MKFLLEILVVKSELVDGLASELLEGGIRGEPAIGHYAKTNETARWIGWGGGKSERLP